MNGRGPQIISTADARRLVARMDMMEKQIQALLDGMNQQAQASQALADGLEELEALLKAPRTDVDLSAPNVIPLEGKVNGQD